MTTPNTTQGAARDEGQLRIREAELGRMIEEGHGDAAVCARYNAIVAELKALQGESTAARDAGQWEREVAVKGNLTKGQTIDVLCDTIQEMERLRAEVIRLRDLGGSVSRKLDDATTEVNRLREQLAVAKSQIDNHDATVEQVRRIERSKSKASNARLVAALRFAYDNMHKWTGTTGPGAVEFTEQARAALAQAEEIRWEPDPQELAHQQRLCEQSERGEVRVIADCGHSSHPDEIDEAGRCVNCAEID